MSTTNATVPPPRRPPTLDDGLRRLTLDPRRLAADVLLAVPVALAAAAWRARGASTVGNVVTFPAPWEPAVFGGCALAAGAVALVLALRPSVRFRPHLVLVLLAAGAGLGVGLVARKPSPMQLWDDRVEVTGRGTFRAIQHKPDPWIAREVDGLPWRTSVEIVSAWPATAPSFPRLLRPDGRDVPRLVTVGALVLWVLDDGTCVLAYDSAKRRDLSGGPIPSLSPFALLGRDERGRESELQALERGVASHRELGFAGRALRMAAPGEQPLLDALDAPNPWVRDAARRLVEAGGEELYPEASKRL